MARLYVASVLQNGTVQPVLALHFATFFVKLSTPPCHALPNTLNSYFFTTVAERCTELEHLPGQQLESVSSAVDRGKISAPHAA